MDHTQQTDIVLAAFNARYSHSSFGARYLLANLGALRDKTGFLEFDLKIQPRIAVEKILSTHPHIVGIGCYIWNIELATKTAALLKKLRPDIVLILGGPEISYETEEQEIFRYADYIICGEGEIEFPKLCRDVLGRRAACDTIDAAVPQAARLHNDPAVPQAARLPDHTGFQPHQAVKQTRRKNLPHWTQDDCIYFVTFRLSDAIPQARIREYEELRRKWKEHHHPPYSKREQERFDELFTHRVSEWLDAGAGSCCLRNPELAGHVAETLQHFNGERYELDEWVIMPNHVHILVKPLPGYELKTILHTWKSYSAHAINKALNRTGSLWQQESYDRMVRDLDELVKIRNYIQRNPEKAGINTAFAGSRRAACDTIDAAVPQAAGLPEAPPVPQAADLPEAPAVPQAARLPEAPAVPQAAGLPEAPAVPPADRRPRIINAEPVNVEQIELPYTLYTDDDIAHRAIYVEASRGCPFRCEYCMSSLDPCVRYFSSELLFEAFDALLQRGGRIFRFVDRSFNINIPFALKILRFFQDRHVPGMMLHFEVIPDHLPDELFDALRQCPEGMLQFEIGIQTLNEEVAHRIQRPLRIAEIETNLKRLRAETGIHIHADLIAGLPGEDLESFEAGFNRLLAMNPQEIQLGILKRLRGAPIARHTKEWNMVYSPHAPYEILQTDLISYQQMQRVQRFARYWNLTVNNGYFPDTAPWIWKDLPSPFTAFMEWSDWLYAETNTTGNLQFLRLARLLLDFLTMKRGLNEEDAAKTLWTDYQRTNRPDVPRFLKKYGFGHGEADTRKPDPKKSSTLPRQKRHLK